MCKVCERLQAEATTAQESIAAAKTTCSAEYNCLNTEMLEAAKKRGRWQAVF